MAINRTFSFDPPTSATLDKLVSESGIGNASALLRLLIQYEYEQRRYTAPVPEPPDAITAATTSK